MERLDKIIANRGIASRREVKELVRQGRVLVDGVPAAAPDMKISPETAAITVGWRLSSVAVSTAVNIDSVNFIGPFRHK